MIAFLTPVRRPSLSITGVTQCVVQLAPEMTSVAHCGVLTRWTIGSTSSLVDGDDRMTYRAPARIWTLRSCRRVNAPVHPNAVSTLNDRRDKRAGARSGS